MNIVFVQILFMLKRIDFLSTLTNIYTVFYNYNFNLTHPKNRTKKMRHSCQFELSKISKKILSCSISFPCSPKSTSQFPSSKVMHFMVKFD